MCICVDKLVLNFYAGVIEKNTSEDHPFEKMEPTKLKNSRLGLFRWLFTKPLTCTLLNFKGETKNFLDCLLFVIFL